jgi:hypothetical protein
MKKIISILILCSFVGLVLSACVAGNRDMLVNLKESSVNDVIQSAPVAQDTPFHIDGIDMQDGFMRVFMSYQMKDGSALNGSYDIALKVNNGDVSAEIKNVNMPGLVLDEKIIKQISDLIARDFVFSASQVQGQVDIKSLLIKEDNVQMVMRKAE